MSVDPDRCTAKQHLTVGVCVVAFMLMDTTKLFDSLVDGHCVGQNMVSNQQLNAVPTTTVRY